MRSLSTMIFWPLLLLWFYGTIASEAKPFQAFRQSQSQAAQALGRARRIALPIRRGLPGGSFASKSNSAPSKRSAVASASKGPHVLARLDAELARTKRNYADSTTAVSRRKRGLPLSEGRGAGARLLEKRQNSTFANTTMGNVTLWDVGSDFAYYTTVEVGTPPQSFFVEIGTGSSDFFLPSPKCCGVGGNNITNKFIPSQSTTWVNSTRRVTLDYVNASMTGWIGSDTVSISNFSIPHQNLGVMDVIPQTGVNVDYPTSGLMGFGWQGLYDFPGLPWWMNLMANDTLQYPIFSLYLARELLTPNSGAQSGGGALALGFADSTYYTGNITFSLMNATNTTLDYWKVPIQSLTIGNGTVPARNSIAVVDIATSLVGGPSDIIAALYGLVPGAMRGNGELASYYTVPCNSTPPLSFKIANVTYPVSPADFVIRITQNICVGALYPLNVGGAISWVLGDSFLKNVYTVFQSQPPAVGFAQLRPLWEAAGTNTSSLAPSSTPPPTNTQTVFVPPSTTAPPQTAKNAASSLAVPNSLFGVMALVLAISGGSALFL